MFTTRVVLATTATVLVLAAAALSLPQERNAEAPEAPEPGRQTALLRVARHIPVMLPSANDRVETQEEYLELLSTYAKLLKSSFVIHAALRDPKVAELATQAAGKRDPADWLADQLSVATGEGQLLSVSLKRGAVADAAQRGKLVNAVVNAFMMEIVNSERENLLRQRDSLEKMAAKARKEMQDKSKVLFDRRRQEGLDLTEIKLRVGEQKLSAYSARRDTVALHKLSLEADRGERLAANEKKEPKPDAAADEMLRDLDSQIRADDYQITQLESQIAAHYEQLSRLQVYSIDLEARVQEVKQLQIFVDKLDAHLRDARLNIEAKPRVSIIETAAVPQVDK